MTPAVHLVSFAAYGPRWDLMLQSVHAGDTVILLDLRGASASAPTVRAQFLFPQCAHDAANAPGWCQLVDDGRWASWLTDDLPVLSWT